jgi:O-antigen/teichoic acid export membrane protein
MLIFVSVFDFAWQPFYLNHYKERGSDKLFGRILTYYCVISSLIFLLLVFFVENLVKIPFPGGTLINYKYWLGLGILPIIIIAYFFYGLYINFSIGVIIANKTISTTIALGIAVIVNLISNFILIPQFGYYGAAYSILISYFIAMLIIFLLSNKHYKVSYEWKRVSIVLLTTIIVYLLYSALNEIINNEVLILLIKISGIFLYLLILRYIGILTAGEKELLKKFFSRK